MKFISQKEAYELLTILNKSGCSESEIFMEHTVTLKVEMVDGQVRSAKRAIINGVAMRLLDQGKEYRSSCQKMDMTTLKETAIKCAEQLHNDTVKDVLPFKEAYPLDIVYAEKPGSSLTMDEKMSYLSKMNDIIYDYSKKEKDNIVQTCILQLVEEEHHLLIINSVGTYQEECRPYTRMYVSCAAGEGENRQTFGHDIGDGCGYECLDKADFKALAKSVVDSLDKVYHAPEMVGGTYDVIVGNGFGGVILHEACVHGLEATALVGHATVFEGKLGQRIAHPCVNAVDDGTLKQRWGSMNVDDEGHRTQRNLLIENGILKSYLIDKRGGVKLGLTATGSGRRENYSYAPTSRMTNTFFLPGQMTFDELVKGIKLGFYAKEMGGGSVDPATSEFNFAVKEGYMIRDGKIGEAVRGATLVGKGCDILMKIDGICKDNLSLSNGICGSISGNVPTTVGEPPIRVRQITVGGKGVNHD